MKSERFKPIFGEEYSEPLSWAKKKRLADEYYTRISIKPRVTEDNLDNFLIILTGVPGTGKSTISKFLYENFNFNFVATDGIKIFLQSLNLSFVKPDLFHIQAMIFRKLMNNGVNVTSDSNSGLSTHRLKLKKMAQSLNYKTINIYLSCDLETAFNRVIERNQVFDEEKINEWHRKIYAHDRQTQKPRNAIEINTDKSTDAIFQELKSIIPKIISSKSTQIEKI